MSEEYKKPTKEELLDLLDEMANNIEKLPPGAMIMPISNGDQWALIVLLSAILRLEKS